MGHSGTGKAPVPARDMLLYVAASVSVSNGQELVGDHREGNPEVAEGRHVTDNPWASSLS